MQLFFSWRVWLWLGGAVNIGGVLLFSQGLQSDTLGTVQPGVLSVWGLLAIMLWGMAYLAASVSTTPNRTLLGVFALEKLLYVAAWFSLIISLPNWLELWTSDPLATLFLAIYGLNDLLFAVVFALLAIRARAPQTAHP